jgi:hypothetical protein
MNLNIKRIHLISYADDTFARAQQVQSLKAITLGFGYIIQSSQIDLSANFRARNRQTLDLKRGAGYWIWKPAILLDYSKRQEYGINLLYLDSGCLPRKTEQEFRELLTDNRIHVWTEGRTPLRLWIDQGVIDALIVEDRSLDMPMIWAGAILAKNSAALTRFCKVWLEMCEDSSLLRPETLPFYEKPNGLIWHRHDQAILTVIVRRHPEWFVIHGENSEIRDSEHYFNRSRILKPKVLLLILNFSKLRKIRRKAVDHMPRKVRIFLRENKARFDGKAISSSEQESLREFY